MTGGGTAAQEKMSIQAVELTTTGVKVYAKSDSGAQIALDSAIIKDASGNVATAGAGLAVTGGPVLTTLTPISVTYTFPSSGAYTVTLVSQQSGSFVSPSFQVTVATP